MLTLEQKQAIVAQLAAVAERAYSAVAAEYAGLDVAQMTDLRKAARSAGVYLRVVKNTLARRALENTPFACMNEGLKGPLLLAFSQGDPGAAARVLAEFAKNNDKLVIKLVALDGKLLPPRSIEEVARLPTRQEALAMLAGVMKAPVVRLVCTLAEPYGMLVRTLAAIRDRKQAA